MASFDQDRVYSVQVYDRDRTAGPSTETASEAERLLSTFLQEYRVGVAFIYR